METFLLIAIIISLIFVFTITSGGRSDESKTLPLPDPLPEGSQNTRHLPEEKWLANYERFLSDRKGALTQMDRPRYNMSILETLTQNVPDPEGQEERSIASGEEQVANAPERKTAPSWPAWKDQRNEQT